MDSDWPSCVSTRFLSRPPAPTPTPVSSTGRRGEGGASTPERVPGPERRTERSAPDTARAQLVGGRTHPHTGKREAQGCHVLAQ